MARELQLHTALALPLHPPTPSTPFTHTLLPQPPFTPNLRHTPQLGSRLQPGRISPLTPDPPNRTCCTPQAHAALFKLHASVAEELLLHGSYAVSWGLPHDLAAASAASPATTAYTSFLLEVAGAPSSVRRGVLHPRRPLD